MTDEGHPRRSHLWLVPATLVALVAAHLLAYAGSRAILPTALAATVIVVAVLAHVGAFGWLYTLARRRRRHRG